MPKHTAASLPSLARGSQTAAGPVAATPCKWSLRPRGLRKSQPPGDTSTRATADRRQKKIPTACGLESSTTAAPLAPFPSKGSPVEIQAGVLARGTHLLSAPSQGLIPQWSSQISFRSQLRGSAGIAPASLLTAPCCEATWLSSTRQLLVHPTTIASTLQDKFCGDDQSADDPVGSGRCGLAPPARSIDAREA
jgi:hypothetical protein